MIAFLSETGLYLKPIFNNSNSDSMIYIIFNMDLYSYFYTSANERDH
jgi:hypothetical protein